MDFYIDTVDVILFFLVLGLTIFGIYKLSIAYYFYKDVIKITESPKWTNILLILEYLILVSVLLILILKPYTSNHSHAIGGTTFIINPAINYLLVTAFIIIAIRTTFTVPISIYNTSLFIGITILVIISRNYINSYFWGDSYPESEYTDEKFIPQIIFYSMILPMLYSLYKIIRSSTEMVIFSIIPMLLFFFIFIYTQTTYKCMPSKESDKIYDELGLGG